jgi:colicin import membrane protein
MSQMIIAESPKPALGVIPKSDPYELGWREVVHTLPTGERKRERIPLTLQDILHPQEGDYRVHSDEHERLCIYAFNVLTLVTANDPHAVVLHDTRVAWGDPAVEPHGLDIAVIFNVRERRDWSTFDCVAEGTKPAIIIEVTSPKTRTVDVDDKVDEYEQVGVEYYVIIDIRERRFGKVRQISGRRLTPEGYVPMVANERGWLWLEPVRLWIGMLGDELAFFDERGDYIDGALATWVARAEAAEERAEVAEERAEAAEKRAADEANARRAMESRLQELEAEIRRLRGQSDK